MFASHAVNHGCLVVLGCFRTGFSRASVLGVQLNTIFQSRFSVRVNKNSSLATVTSSWKQKRTKVLTEQRTQKLHVMCRSLMRRAQWSSKLFTRPRRGIPTMLEQESSAIPRYHGTLMGRKSRRAHPLVLCEAVANELAIKYDDCSPRHMPQTVGVARDSSASRFERKILCLPVHKSCDTGVSSSQQGNWTTRPGRESPTGTSCSTFSLPEMDDQGPPASGIRTEAQKTLGFRWPSNLEGNPASRLGPKGSHNVPHEAPPSTDSPSPGRSPNQRVLAVPSIGELVREAFQSCQRLPERARRIRKTHRGQRFSWRGVRPRGGPRQYSWSPMVADGHVASHSVFLHTCLISRCG